MCVCEEGGGHLPRLLSCIIVSSCDSASLNFSIRQRKGLRIIYGVEISVFSGMLLSNSAWLPLGFLLLSLSGMSWPDCPPEGCQAGVRSLNLKTLDW